LVGDELHVLNIWDSQEDNDVFMTQLAPVLREARVELVGVPVAGEVLKVVQPSGAGLQT
jgi:hypothetical protein